MGEKISWFCRGLGRPTAGLTRFLTRLRLEWTILSSSVPVAYAFSAQRRAAGRLDRAVSHAAASLLAFLPSLGTREVFAFGEGVTLPMRLRFSELPAHMIPQRVRTERSRRTQPRGR